MTCEQCMHRSVCNKEHYATDINPEHFYYSDLNNVEEKCDNFIHELNIQKLPCHVGQPVWLLREGYKNGVKQWIVDDMYVFTIRSRLSLETDTIQEGDGCESRVQIFLGYEGNPYRMIEVRDFDFGKIVFTKKTNAEIELQRMKNNNNL